MNISKIELSGSTDGRPIKVAATSTPGTTIHTSQAGTVPNSYDEIWLWAYNSDTENRPVTIEFGGTTSPDDTIKMTLAFQSGLYLVIPGLILQNSAVVKAFGLVANVITIVGYVNRLTA